MTRLDVTTIKAAGSAEPVSRCRKLYRRADDEDRRCRPNIRRSMSLVRPDLQQTFLHLGTGKLPWPLYLHGPVGSGKTRAALAFLDGVARVGYWRRNRVMEGIMERSAPWQGWFSGLHLAVLDEIGSSLRVGDLEYNAVVGFAEWRDDQPAIFISNHEPDKILDLYDRRIYSRLTCGTRFPLVDVDRRMERPEWLEGA